MDKTLFFYGISLIFFHTKNNKKNKNLFLNRNIGRGRGGGGVLVEKNKL